MDEWLARLLTVTYPTVIVCASALLGYWLKLRHERRMLDARRGQGRPGSGRARGPASGAPEPAGGDAGAAGFHRAIAHPARPSGALEAKTTTPV